MTTETGLALLRKPFPRNLISKLPKPTAKRDVMDGLPKAMCAVCGTYHATSKVIHLDYVGHAALTDRLLDVLGRLCIEIVPDDLRALFRQLQGDGTPDAPTGSSDDSHLAVEFRPHVTRARTA